MYSCGVFFVNPGRWVISQPFVHDLGAMWRQRHVIDAPPDDVEIVTISKLMEYIGMTFFISKEWIKINLQSY